MKVVFDTCLYLEQAFSGRLVTFILYFFPVLTFFVLLLVLSELVRDIRLKVHIVFLWLLFVSFFFVYFEISSFLLYVCWKFFRRMKRTIWMARSYF